MAAPAIVPILKKVATYVLTDKKLLKTVLGIVLGIIIIILMPLIAIFTIGSGHIQVDTDYIQSNIIANLTPEDTAKLQKIEDDMNSIQTKMTEAGYDETKVKRAQVLYTLALYDYSDRDNFIDDLVGCFAEIQTNEELISAVNLKFGTNISYTEFEQVISKIEDESADTSSESQSG